MRDIFYTDETRVKDLTVGQLKDIIMELLSSGRIPSFKNYIFEEGKGKFIPNRPVYPDPTIDPYC